MSKMSDVSIAIEEMFDTGASYEEISASLQTEYLIDNDTAMSWISGVALAMDEFERRLEIQTEARFL